jgi:predicted dehydrogenase
MTVDVALVGAGWWAANHHLPALAGHPHARVVAVCDPDRDRADELAARVGARSFPTAADAWTAVPVDAVVVATPHAFHHEVVAAALDAGLHVLVEKPMTLTAADAFDLVRRAEEAGVHLTVGYTHHFQPAALAARDAVANDIGDLLQVTVEFSSRTGPLFERAERGESGDRPEQQHAESYSAEHGGGQAHTQLTHALGMLTWVTGDQLTEVAAFTSSGGLDVDVDDAAAFRLASGATGVAVGTGRTADAVPVREHLRYHGTAGVVEQDLARGRTVVRRADGTAVVTELAEEEPAYDPGAPARAFVGLVRGEGPDLAPARPAAATVAAIEALLTAAREGRVVAVPQLPDRQPRGGSG